MAPLSILPGRVRFEDARLFGNKIRSRHLEAKIAALPGVHLVSATHRTGRILVEFNEFQLTHNDLVARLGETLSCEIPFTDAGNKGAEEPTKPGKNSSLLSSSTLADVALHLLLPAPFDLLLPAFGSTFRRDQSLS